MTTSSDRRPSATSFKSSKAADREASAELVQKILDVERHHAQSEGEAVDAILEKGQLLGELKSHAKRDWGARLREVKVNPRVASRLMKIGARGRDLGLNGSDLLANLPHDVHKLEWILKLELEQLRPFVQDLDCRSESREKVVQAVKQLLGQDEAASDGDDDDRALKTVERSLARLVVAIESLGSAAPEGFKERIRDDVISALGVEPNA